MKAVMISIRPKWIAKIASGEKTVEVRKSVPKCGAPFKVYMYCTNDKNYKIAPFDFADGWHIKKYDDTTHYACGCTWRKRDDLNGTVVGEFVCDRISDIKFHNLYGYLGAFDYEDTGLVSPELQEYAKGETVWGLHISDLKIYDKPKELSEFMIPCREVNCKKMCYDCWGHPQFKKITRPPQSWCYVEEQ